MSTHRDGLNGALMKYNAIRV